RGSQVAAKLRGQADRVARARPCLGDRGPDRARMSSTLDRATEERLVRLAMAQAAKAIDRGDAPFGAVLADADGRVLAKASNRQVSRHDPTAHGEITLLRVAARRLGRLTFEGLRVVTNA